MITNMPIGTPKSHAIKIFHPRRLNNEKISAMTNKTIKIKKIILAIDAEAAAIPVNPKTAAIIAIIKNVNTQPNISFPLVFY